MHFLHTCAKMVFFFQSINEFAVGQVASGLPPISIPPFHTKINGKTLYFTDMITHIGTTIIALPLISLLESIAVAKAFCEYFSVAFCFIFLGATNSIEEQFFCFCVFSDSKRKDNRCNAGDVSVGHVQHIWIIFAIDASDWIYHSYGCEQCQWSSYNTQWNCKRCTHHVGIGLLDQCISFHTKNNVGSRYYMRDVRDGRLWWNQGYLAIKTYVSTSTIWIYLIDLSRNSFKQVST